MIETRMIMEETPQYTIQELRAIKDWTQFDLARESGYTMSVISRMENGKPVNRSTFQAICTALGVKPEQVKGVVFKRRTLKTREE